MKEDKKSVLKGLKISQAVLYYKSIQKVIFAKKRKILKLHMICVE
jgi:hypothetical protein